MMGAEGASRRPSGRIIILRRGSTYANQTNCQRQHSQCPELDPFIHLLPPVVYCQIVFFKFGLNVVKDYKELVKNL
jgi:hypothetical protein